MQKVWAFSDLHGHLEIYQKIREIVPITDILIFCGDAGDRGPQSWETIKAILDDPDCTYIKGNHEDMLIKAIEDYLEDGEMWDYHSYSLCRMNGGEETMLAWERDPQRMEYYRKLKALSTWTALCIEGDTWYFTHAGFTPWIAEGDDCADMTTHDLIWDREHYLEPWSPDEMEDCYQVHGHTPCYHLSEDLWVDWEEDGPLVYADGHKICIDTGGFFSDIFCLLDVTTGESYILESK